MDIDRPQVAKGKDFGGVSENAIGEDNVDEDDGIRWIKDHIVK